MLLRERGTSLCYPNESRARREIESPLSDLRESVMPDDEDEGDDDNDYERYRTGILSKRSFERIEIFESVYIARSYESHNVCRENEDPPLHAYIYYIARGKDLYSRTA